MSENKHLDFISKDFESLVLKNGYSEVADYVNQVTLYIKKLMRGIDRKKIRKFIDSEKSDSRWMIERIENKNSLEYCVGYYAAYLEAIQCVLDVEELQERAQELLIEHSDSISHFDEILSYIKESDYLQHSHLASRLGIKVNTLTDIMEKVCQTGLVAFTRSGRLKHYYLTDAGKKYQGNRQQWKKHLSKTKRLSSQPYFENYYEFEQPMMYGSRMQIAEINSTPKEMGNMCWVMNPINFMAEMQNNNRVFDDVIRYYP